MNPVFADQESVIHEIVRLYEDYEGFLVQLRAAHFDEPLFEQCVDAVKQYHAFVKTSRLIDKRVVRFLYDTAITLEGLLTQLDQRNHPAAKSIREAYAIWLKLIDQLLIIEPPDPNTGQQLILF